MTTSKMLRACQLGQQVPFEMQSNDEIKPKIYASKDSTGQLKCIEPPHCLHHCGALCAAHLLAIKLI